MTAPTYTPPAWSPTKGAYASTSSPKILKVTKLGGKDAGSFKMAWEAKEPRLIYFDDALAGVINGGGGGARWIASMGEVTVIGSPKVCIAGGVLSMRGIQEAPHKNIILSGLTVRNASGAVDCVDTTELEGMLVDRCTFGWSGDELLTAYRRCKKVAVTRSIFSEPMSLVGHSKGEHGFAVMFGDQCEDVLFAGNLVSHFQRRGPQIGRSKRWMVANNVIYDWAHNGVGTNIARSSDNADWPHEGAIVANHYVGKRRPGAAISLRYMLPGSKLWISGNIDGDGKPMTIVPANGADGFDMAMLQPPASLPDWKLGWTMLAAKDVDAFVMANAGSGEPHDKRLKDAFKARGGSQPVNMASFATDPYAVYAGGPVVTPPAPVPTPTPTPTPMPPPIDYEALYDAERERREDEAERADAAEAKLSAARGHVQALVNL